MQYAGKIIVLQGDFFLSQKTWSSLRAVGPTLRAGSWARSETIGYAMNPAASGSGIMEYRRSAFGGLE